MIGQVDLENVCAEGVFGFLWKGSDFFAILRRRVWLTNSYKYKCLWKMWFYVCFYFLLISDVSIFSFPSRTILLLPNFPKLIPFLSILLFSHLFLCVFNLGLPQWILHEFVLWWLVEESLNEFWSSQNSAHNGMPYLILTLLSSIYFSFSSIQSFRFWFGR